MKKNQPISLAVVNQVTLQQLPSIVAETIAYEFCRPAAAIFTAAQLWHIQRQVKSRTTRRFI